jgi:hypothetical protein
LPTGETHQGWPVLHLAYVIVVFERVRHDAQRHDQFYLREWMEKNTYLPVHELDEDGDVEGEA